MPLRLPLLLLMQFLKTKPTSQQKTLPWQTKFLLLLWLPLQLRRRSLLPAKPLSHLHLCKKRKMTRVL
jgi:hypothetical protein